MLGGEVVLARGPAGTRMPTPQLELEHEDLLRQLIAHTTSVLLHDSGDDKSPRSGAQGRGAQRSTEADAQSVSKVKSVCAQQTLLVLEHFYLRSGCDDERLRNFVRKLDCRGLVDSTALCLQITHIQQLRAQFLHAILAATSTQESAEKSEASTPSTSPSLSFLALTPAFLRATPTPGSASTTPPSNASDSSRSPAPAAQSPTATDTPLAILPQPVQFCSNAASSLLSRGFVEMAQLGKGAFGSVVKVRSVVDGMTYAVKKIPFEVPLDLAASSLVEKVLREVCALAKLDHANVLRYYSCWVDAQGLGEGRTSSVELEQLDGDDEFGDSAGGECYDVAGCLVGTVDGADLQTSEEESKEAGRRKKRKKKRKGDQRKRVEEEDECEVGLSRPEAVHASSTDDLSSRILFEDNTETGEETSGLFWFEESKSGSSSEDTQATSNKPPEEQNKAVVPYARSRPVERVRFMLFLQTQCCNSGSLKDWLCDPARSEVDAAASFDVFHGILEGLAHIHDRGIVHRDLKPANIFFDVDSTGRKRVKIGDFGLAKMLAPGHQQQRQKRATPLARCGEEASLSCSDVDNVNTCGVGTVPYASPEQLAHTDYTTKADIYSLGIILLELFSVFSTASERAHVISDLRSRGSIPAATAALYPTETKLVRAMVAADPAARPTARAILEHPDFRRLVRTNARLTQKQLEQEIIDLRQLLCLREQQLARLRT